MHAFVGADRHRPRDARECSVVTRRQRLLDQRDARFGAGGEVDREVLRAPRLVGVDDQLAFGAALRTARMRAGSPSPPSFTLSNFRDDAFAAASAMASGVPSEIV